MLLNDFFTIASIENQEGDVQAILSLNASHKIFEGHFPGQPVVPGVCMIQMLKEITETTTGKQLRLIRADYIKFLSVVDPQQNNSIQAALKYIITENDEVTVVASLLQETVTCLKFKGLFRKQ